MISRRTFALLLLPATAGPGARAAHPPHTAGAARPRPDVGHHWLHGTWLSDRERTMAHLRLQGRPLDPALQEDVARLFGERRYEIGATTFVHREPGHEVALHYRIGEQTATSATLHFRDRADLPPLTLHRADGGGLFTRHGSHVEYFRRLAPDV